MVVGPVHSRGVVEVILGGPNVGALEGTGSLT